MGECYERFKLGCLMGASVGAGIGLLFGTISAIGHPNGFFRQLRRATLGSAASFGFFMGIGSLIRCDGGASRRRH